MKLTHLQMKKSSIFIIFVLFALFSTLFSSSLVSAEPLPFLEKAADVFGKWQGGEQIGENITKYLVWLIVGLVLFAVFNHIPLIKGDNFKWLRAILAVVVSFLSIAYLAPQDLYVILAGYNAMGVVLAGILPFIIIAYFSTSVASDGSPGSRLLTKAVWVLFIIYLGYRLIYSWQSGVVSGAVTWTYIGLIIFGILYILFFEKILVSMLFKEEINQGINKIEKSSTRAAQADIAINRKRANELREAGLTQEADELDRAAERLEDALKK
jgi:hypothetical protein